MSTKDVLFDRRVAVRNINNARASRKEYEQYLAGLPDVSGKAVSVFSTPEPRASTFARERDEEEDEEDEEPED